MKPVHMFTVIDSHTAGAATRIVTSGTPRLKGDTMHEKMEDFREHHDHIRRTLMLEPRGNENMSGAFLTEPTSEDSDLGVIFTHAHGYHTMCGHGAIGVACAAVETGLFRITGPSATLRLETPAGLIPVRLEMRQGRVHQASFCNVPSFLLSEGLEVTLPDGRDIEVDVAFGGVPVIIVKAEDVSLDISEESIPQAVELGLSIHRQVIDRLEVCHPESRQPLIPDLVMFNGSPTKPEARFKDVVVSSTGEVDRSPCGAATSARMAQLHAQGALDLGEDYIQEGILGTVFSGQLVESTEINGHQAVIPEVSGRAHIIGMNQWVIDDDDPLNAGFSL